MTKDGGTNYLKQQCCENSEVIINTSQKSKTLSKFRESPWPLVGISWTNNALVPIPACITETLAS